MRVWVLILLLANAVLAGFLYLTEMRVPATAPSSDLNAGNLRLLPVSQEKPAITSVVENGRKGAAFSCVEWSGIAASDLRRARDLMDSLTLPAERVVERRIEDATSFWVNIPPASTAAATVAKIKQAGLQDVSLQPNNAISLGIFSTEESARRALSQVWAKGFSEARIEPRNLHLKAVTLTVREAGADIVKRLDEFKQQIAGSSVRAVECP